MGLPLLPMGPVLPPPALFVHPSQLPQSPLQQDFFVCSHSCDPCLQGPPHSGTQHHRGYGPTGHGYH